MLDANFLRSVVAEVEGLQARRAQLDRDVGAVLRNATRADLDPRALRTVLARRKMTEADRRALDGMVASFEMALASPGDVPGPAPIRLVEAPDVSDEGTSREVSRRGPAERVPNPPPPTVPDGAECQWGDAEFPLYGRLLGCRDGVCEVEELVVPGEESRAHGGVAGIAAVGGRRWRLGLAELRAVGAPSGPGRPTRLPLLGIIIKHRRDEIARIPRRTAAGWLVKQTGCDHATCRKALQQVAIAEAERDAA